MATVGALADVAPPSRGNPLSSTQRWRRVAVILLVLLLLTAAVHAQQIPAIPEIPACVTGELRAQLEQALASLVQRRNALREHANQHNGHCKAVLEGSPLEAPCTLNRRS